MLSSGDIQALLRKALAAAIGAVLGFVLLSALLIGGFVMLLKAATLGLSPWVGDAGAYGITGGVCFILLAVFFFRMFKGPVRQSSPDAAGSRSPVDAVRKLIIENPWEAILMAFALGITEQSDPRMRQMLMQSGMAFFKAANAMDDPEAGNDGPDATAAAKPDEAPSQTPS